MKLFMSEAEIVREYRQAKYKDREIRILADLNLCDPKEIREIIEKSEKAGGTV